MRLSWKRSASYPSRRFRGSSRRATSRRDPACRSSSSAVTHLSGGGVHLNRRVARGDAANDSCGCAWHRRPRPSAPSKARDGGWLGCFSSDWLARSERSVATASGCGRGRTFGTSFPYGTFAVNVAGCFLIALIGQLAVATTLIPPTLRLTLMTGFMGGAHDVLELQLRDHQSATRPGVGLGLRKRGHDLEHLLHRWDARLDPGDTAR